MKGDPQLDMEGETNVAGHPICVQHSAEQHQEPAGGLNTVVIEPQRCHVRETNEVQTCYSVRVLIQADARAQ